MVKHLPMNLYREQTVLPAIGRSSFVRTRLKYLAFPFDKKDSETKGQPLFRNPPYLAANLVANLAAIQSEM